MGEFIDAVTSWKALLVALLIFGFAPGAVLRVIVLAFRREDPRRQELRAELHSVPRIERPIWVVEQLEVALFEGVGERIVWMLTGRVFDRWSLMSGVKQNAIHPDTFWIPDDDEKAAIVPGCHVKLMFMLRRWPGERMWVRVDRVKSRGRLVGTLMNDPVFVPRLYHGDRVKFTLDDIIDYSFEGDDLCEVIDCCPDHSSDAAVDATTGLALFHAECHGPTGEAAEG